MRPLLVADDHSAPTRVSPTSALVRRCIALRAMAAPILMMGAALIAYGCGNDDRPVRTVDVSAGEYSITVDRPVVASGSIEFKATHVGAEPHELAILRTDLPPGELPLTDDNTVDVDGGGVNFVGEIERLDPGEIESLTLDLDPGAYIVICNVEHHYERGMRASVEVE